MADTFKFRIDHHGSLVRPPELLAARAAVGLPPGDKSEMSGEEAAALRATDALRATEDAAIAEAVRQQRKLSLTVVTDGEFRREESRDAIFSAVGGFRRTPDGSWHAAGELTPHRSLVADDVAAVAGLTQVPAKATLPSPAHLAATTFAPGGPWRSARELGEALAVIIREEIQAIIARGVRLIQLDNHGYASLLFGGGPAALTLEDAIAVDAAAVTIPDKPYDVRIGLCPLTRAGAELDVAAASALFAGVPVDRWVLPYDTGAPAETELLRLVPADRDVCLGVVSPLTAALEDVGTVMDRLDTAGTIRDLEDVAISPSAGFAPVAGRPSIGVGDQWRKLTHVETFARMCWGNEL
ncbi:5-methyltetrahydropteroyltriglutamate--homocystei ne S-methyltransferase [Actinoplanes sp. OR16]|uniref:methionine synthase II (cobalamin-independent)-like protein n=1 Tax=Actinoplanes sp. OR16 TaxID=946334 RepID=UPI000F6F1C8A|nr:methionine synthase II (cobalamin-independent)-like protein [Actinoplanes sp. OR16]BBH71108.1 5-methyltetrahydropteroyltriglutamate--homocystei ne S-methyltransferase [Actinoplanes sp. OR16]